MTPALIVEVLGPVCVGDLQDALHELFVRLIVLHAVAMEARGNQIAIYVRNHGIDAINAVGGPLNVEINCLISRKTVLTLFEMLDD